jgi:hypothetical protein
MFLGLVTLIIFRKGNNLRSSFFFVQFSHPTSWVQIFFSASCRLMSSVRVLPFCRRQCFTPICIFIRGEQLLRSNQTRIILLKACCTFSVLCEVSGGNTPHRGGKDIFWENCVFLNLFLKVFYFMVLYKPACLWRWEVGLHFRSFDPPCLNEKRLGGSQDLRDVSLPKINIPASARI